MAADFLKNAEKVMDYFHKKGAFLSVKHEDKANTMTISWGNIGYQWGKPIFSVMVRKSRYTHELLEKSGEFTVSIPLKDGLKKALDLCGSKSGRVVDKFEAANITAQEGRKVNAPVITHCDIYFECKVVYKHDMNAAMLSEDILNTSYIDGDLHTIYYGEIVDCYQGE
ncbi:flavin reductase family protein [Clostridium thermarum]|uniref:flavin reductase family protein n=1 Tax=Clostridium thermarum TaxID=1716543 RepID=UPI001124819B|nr:flavin reductase family protein [Clostridium thermarum]